MRGNSASCYVDGRFAGKNDAKKSPGNELETGSLQNRGSYFYLKLELFLLTVKLLHLQSLKALIRPTFPL